MRARGYRGAGLGAFDSAMAQIMTARGISCGQLAVVRDDRLVLARGYTLSDDSSLSVLPTSLFRIASLSKPVTAVAVACAGDDGELGLLQSIVDQVDMTPLPGRTLDARLRNTHPLRLMRHEGGFDAIVDRDVTIEDRSIAAELDVPCRSIRSTSPGTGRACH